MLGPMALDVVMSLIVIGIPAWILLGCIMTRRHRHVAEPHAVTPHFELDRAA